MRKHIKQLSNLIEVINSGMIAVTSVRSECKLASDYTERTDIPPEKFTESIELLDKSIFKDAVDLYFEFTENNQLIITCDRKCKYFDEFFYIKCLHEIDKREDIETLLGMSIFDKIANDNRENNSG